MAAVYHLIIRCAYVRIEEAFEFIIFRGRLYRDSMLILSIMCHVFVF